MSELWRLGLIETVEGYRSGAFTPVEMMGSVLDRLEAVNGRVNAFAFIDRAGARDAAAASARRYASGTASGALDGTVVSVKDNINVAGMPTTWGSEMFRDFVPEDDEVPVERLKAAGAIILGKATTSEFSTGRGIVSTLAFGTTRNPWNLDLTSGSSSGGPAAAVASGVGAAALGTDGGGSLRRPGAHCGLLGFKPSTGFVARGRGLPVILNEREVVGPLVRTSKDLAAILRALAGPHPLDHNSWAFQENVRSHSVVDPAPQRILYVRSFGHPVDEQISRRCDEVAANLAVLGHVIEEGDAPFDTALQEKYAPLISQAGVAWLMRGREWRGKVHPHYEEMIEKGSRLSASDYIEILSNLRTIQGQIGMFFERFDLMLTPTTGKLPGPADQPGPKAENVFPGFANTAHIPSISIPAGLSAEGLPIGFQLTGRFGSDWNLVQMATAYERRFPWENLRPKI